MTRLATYPFDERFPGRLHAVAGLVVAVLFLSQAVCHGCPITDKSDPTTVFSSALSDRAVLCLSHQGSVVHPTKCRPDTGGVLPCPVAEREETVRSAGGVRSVALHLACSSRKLLLLKSHLLI